MATMDADLALLRRYADDGDAEAFAELVRRHAGLVFGTCVRILGDRGRAEDVSQEAFYRLMRRPERVERSPGAWLHRVATHLSLDVLRSDTARIKRERAYALQQQRRQAPNQWQELSPMIDAALESLPDEQRALLVDHFLMGRPQRQIGRDLGVSPATMSRRMSGALAALRRELRRKGLAMSVGALTGLLVLHPAEAAPVTLMQELGKMSLFTEQMAGTLPMIGGGFALKAAAIVLGGIVLGLAAFALTGVGGGERSVTSPSADDARPALVTTPTPAGQ